MKNEEISKKESEIARKVFSQIEINSEMTPEAVDQLIISEIKKSNLFSEDWQVHYSKERILKNILKLKYNNNADKYYHLDRKINKKKFLFYPIIGWLPGLFLFGGSESEGFIKDKSFLRHFKGINLLWNFLIALFPTVITFGIISVFIPSGLMLLLSFGLWIIFSGIIREKIILYLRCVYQKNGHCPHCKSALIFEPSDFKSEVVICPLCSKKFNLR